ncbi:MAG: DUF899 domain-containing protein [Reyranella sp.]|uniref:DUF899 domain-containing protein n=1 Tax=Reyranella sp. TaxID=1929291 RepID=UPI001AC2EDA0|nr:DUF899 domain-containing protein [Reyranella sp.]MBN9085525.1 DUF899 domain-containing protein [Reyranella sp.]
MTAHRIVSQAEWLEARKALLAKEKAFTQQREELAQERRALPWVKVEKDYVFDAPEGQVTLADLFDGKGQLIVQHFMFGSDWNEGCPSCSFWTDNFNGIDVHLAHRDTAFVLVSRGPIDRLEAYRKRMGWNLRWVSSLNNDFNFDFAVSFPGEPKEPVYNFGTIKPYGQETPGLSALRRGDDGAIYRTYSTYARGLDMLNGTYQLLDITSKGRDEEGLSFSMAWVRRHDKY